MNWNLWRRRSKPCAHGCPVCRSSFAKAEVTNGTAVVCGPRCVAAARARLARRQGRGPRAGVSTCCSGGGR
jgi:hypothetical protein